MLREGQELAGAADFTIPHCVDGIEEAIALIRTNRDEWLRAQAAAKESPPLSPGEEGLKDVRLKPQRRSPRA